MSSNGKREAILQAAWKLIRHYGYAKTTIADIAREADIGKGTVYLHFRSKDEIMLALVDLTNERITKDLEAIAAKDAPALERLRECLLHRVLRIFDLVQRYPHSGDVIVAIKPDIARRIERHVRDQAQLLDRILLDGVRRGEVAVEDTEAVGRTLANLFELLTPPYYRFQSRNALERFATSVLNLLETGLRKGR